MIKKAEVYMSKKEIEIIPQMANYREMLEYARKNYSNNIAYKYK